MVWKGVVLGVGVVRGLGVGVRGGGVQMADALIDIWR